MIRALALALLAAGLVASAPAAAGQFDYPGVYADRFDGVGKDGAKPAPAPYDPGFRGGVYVGSSAQAQGGLVLDSTDDGPLYEGDIGFAWE